MKRVGIRDIANAANVSITTISKALNGYADVSPETREKIKKLAKSMNYVPDSHARYMGGIRKKTVALMLSDLKRMDPSGFVFGVISGLYTACNQNKHSFILLVTSLQTQKESDIIEICHTNNIDALVSMGFRTDDVFVQQMKSIGIPITMLDMQVEGISANIVSINNLQAAYEAVSYLISKNCKNIAMINGSKNTYVSDQRLLGYKKALSENGICFDNKIICNADFDSDIAYNKALKLISNNKNIDAIFCSSDIMAIGACKAIESLSFVVGKDILVFGFDDIPTSQYMYQGITTIKQDPYELGLCAGNSVNEQLLNPNQSSKSFIVPHSLQIRASA